MDSLYNVNGLVFWSEREIRLREQFRDHYCYTLSQILYSMNPAFRIMACEAPILTAPSVINTNYTNDDIFVTNHDNLVLRPETTPGSYVYARHLLDTQQARTPLCIWQYGKSFRHEQDQVTKNMRLKEFYQQEFQCIYTDDTANDYHNVILEPVRLMIYETLRLPTRIVTSDRLPSYSQITIDIEVDNKDKWMEVVSISRRTDFPGTVTFQSKSGPKTKKLLVVEIAIGLDRCVYNYAATA